MQKLEGCSAPAVTAELETVWKVMEMKTIIRNNLR